MNHLKKRVCIKRGAFDNKLDVFVMLFAHDYDDYDVDDDNGCVNAVEVSDDYFYVHLRHFQPLSGN